MDLRNLLVIMHIIGTVLGVGGATVSDMLFFKFAKDGHIDKDEFSILNTTSRLVWIGLGIILLSALGFIALYVSNTGNVQTAYSLDKIWAKSIIVAIIIGNGFVLHYKVLPLFASRLGKTFATKSFIKKSPIVFTAGAISGVSWYTTLILGAWRGYNTPAYITLFVYALIIICAISVSNVVGRHLLQDLHHTHKHRKKTTRGR